MPPMPPRSSWTGSGSTPAEARASAVSARRGGERLAIELAIDVLRGVAELPLRLTVLRAQRENDLETLAVDVEIAIQPGFGIDEQVVGFLRQRRSHVAVVGEKDRLAHLAVPGIEDPVHRFAHRPHESDR